MESYNPNVCTQDLNARFCDYCGQYLQSLAIAVHPSAVVSGRGRGRGRGRARGRIGKSGGKGRGRVRGRWR